MEDAHCIGMGEAGTHLAARGRVYLTDTWETWLRLKNFGREDEADDPLGRDLRRSGRDGRDHKDLADGRPIPWELGRWPNPITINAQTEISEVNPSSRIR